MTQARLPAKMLSRGSDSEKFKQAMTKRQTPSSNVSGAEFLTKKSELNRARDEAASFTDVVVVDDETIDCDRMLATLRVMYGYAVEVRRAASLDEAIKCVMDKRPDLVLLDDILKPSDDATHTIPLLRRAGFDGPIVVISGQVTRTRRPVLLAAGASDVIHKDDVDSVKLLETLQALAPKGAHLHHSKKK